MQHYLSPKMSLYHTSQSSASCSSLLYSAPKSFLQVHSDVLIGAFLWLLCLSRITQGAYQMQTGFSTLVQGLRLCIYTQLKCYWCPGLSEKQDNKAYWNIYVNIYSDKVSIIKGFYRPGLLKHWRQWKTSWTLRPTYSGLTRQTPDFHQQQGNQVNILELL